MVKKLPKFTINNIKLFIAAYKQSNYKYNHFFDLIKGFEFPNERPLLFLFKI